MINAPSIFEVSLGNVAETLLALHKHLFVCVQHLQQVTSQSQSARSSPHTHIHTHRNMHTCVHTMCVLCHNNYVCEHMYLHSCTTHMYKPQHTHTPPSLTHTHSLTYSLTHAHSLTHTHSLTHLLTHTHSLTHSPTHPRHRLNVLDTPNSINVLFRRGSRFRYSGRTLRQTMDSEVRKQHDFQRFQFHIFTYKLHKKNKKNV